MRIRLLVIAALCFTVAACAPSYRYYEGGIAGADGDYYYSDPYSVGYHPLYSGFAGLGYGYSYDPFFRGGFYYGMNRYPYHYGWGPRFAYAAGFGYPYGYGGFASYYYGYHHLSPPRRVVAPRARSAREEAERLARASRTEASGLTSRSSATALRGRASHRDMSYGVQAVPSGYGYSQSVRYRSSTRPAMSARDEARLRYAGPQDDAYRGRAGSQRNAPIGARSAATPTQGAPSRNSSYRAPQRSAPIRSVAPPARSSRSPNRVTEQPPIR